MLPFHISKELQEQFFVWSHGPSISFLELNALCKLHSKSENFDMYLFAQEPENPDTYWGLAKGNSNVEIRTILLCDFDDFEMEDGFKMTKIKELYTMLI